jgi:YhcH/YjgK/YiaL family protein
MILDSLDNLSKYVTLNPRIQKVVDFIKRNDLASIPSGKLLIDGDDVFGNFQTLDGKRKEDAKLETHNVMLDIQVPISTEEVMGFTPRKDLPEMPYNAAGDITFYEGLAEQYVTVHKGEFAIFLPGDGHAPCIGEGKQIQKVIFKVKI